MISFNESTQALQNGDIIMQTADTIDVRPIEWLWKGWLAKGKLHILAGAPGTGKTTITMSLAAIVSASLEWPDGKQASGGDVLIWSGEDDPADTLVPRLQEMGADLSRVHFISGVHDDRGSRSFDPAEDIKRLAVNIQERRPALLIVDPIVSAVSGDSHKNTETRRGLQPLVDMAKEANLAVLGITHFSKGTSGRDPVERITGSLAFGALARVVFVAAKISDENGGGRIFCIAKNNIGKDSGGFKYNLETRVFMEDGETTAVTWGDILTQDARQLLSESERPATEENSAVAQACTFLEELLGGQKMHATSIYDHAKQAGYSRSSITRAKTRLGIKPSKEDQKWYWALPEYHQDTQHTQENMLDTLSILPMGDKND